MTNQTNKELETTVLAGGCFWCVEAAFAQVKGIVHVESGYANGHTENPTYKHVCSGRTGFAEAVQMTYDPNVIQFTELLEMFFTIHDPTSLNQQGADVGEQYRSAIFAVNTEQLEHAKQFVAALSSEQIFHKPIVTVIEMLQNYYPAEDEHQRYFEKHPAQGYCQVVIGPKLTHLKNKFASKMRIS